jgi:hypothetical protein
MRAQAGSAKTLQRVLAAVSVQLGVDACLIWDLLHVYDRLRTSACHLK